MEDKSIIDLYFERDECAIFESERKYGRYCFVIANNILENEHDSDECINDTWNKAWNTIPPQRPNSLKLFLAKITRNLALDRVRTKSREKRIGENLMIAFEEISEIVSDGSNIESELEAKELMDSINSFLHSLSARDCNVFIRRYFFLDSIDTISDKYGLSKANVSKILSRTRASLKIFLNKEGYFI